MEQRQPKRPIDKRRCWASLTAGGALAAIAFAAMCIDLSNNFHYGVQISAELAAVMTLAAIGVTALPAAAALRGWDGLLRLGTAACVLLTVWAAISAYADKQGREILQAQSSQAIYQDARADAARARQEIEAARSEMASISETLPASQLQQLLAAKLAAARQHERWGPTKGCQDVTIPISRKFCDNLAAERQALLVRIGQAKAKEGTRARIEAAQFRLDAATGEAKAGPAQTSMLAEFIAERTGREPTDIARTIALATTGFAIIVTILMACLMHQAIQLIMQGLGLRQAPIDARSAVEVPPVAKPVTAAAPQSDIASTLIRMFIEECFAPGRGSASAGEIYEAFEAWWRASSPGVRIPSQRTLGIALSRAGIGKRKAKGRIVYEATLVEPALAA